MNIIVKNIDKNIKGNQVLDNISIEMCAGNIYGIYGRNGSGKTMLMRALLGLIHVDSGEIMIDGQKIGQDIDFPENVGAIIENPGFFTHATGYENLRLLADIRKKICDDEIRNAMQMVGLNDRDKRTVSKYSLGMKQKLAIAQAIMEKPDLLVLDEPTNALDEESVNQFRDIIKEFAKRGTLVILASHNRDDIETLSDVQIKMEAGKIVDVQSKEG
ncbi:ABC transporter ATP-binding protein [Agathobacter ruminis]|uniref:Multidrug ABC transporter ATP-binding protein n=1 Tax=Agathobacter ruminis TaxID=1712665 RepID=A0A2G3E0H0_9FIRM|nr:ATP-binding cassette domain-containing protein [Agathobacter ruminis]MDC7302165.1 ATP-binding cassette domain-containing protein [Agathobacter ruminis]PHU36744.1 multidrug ABC transporter ATP-binding protein [Agathobacter ruminis]